MENESFYKDIPTLNTIEATLDNEVDRIKGEIDAVKNHPRFESNPSERDYQLGELEAELNTTLAKAEEDFNIELEVVEQHLAIQMFDAPKVDAETAQQAQSLAQDIATQAQLSAAPADTAAMLAVRVKNMTDAQKHALQRQLPVITQEINAKVSPSDKADVAKHIEAVNVAVSDTAHKRSISEQLEALKRIKKGGASVTAKYRQQDIARKIAKQDIGQGAIGRDFWENVAKGGRK